MRVKLVAVVSLLLFLMVVQNSFATNGMNMIGYGARMSGMGGASHGLKNDTNLMNTNPAGIVSIKGLRIDTSLGLLMPSVHFKNNLNDLDADSNIFPLPSIGFVKRLDDSPFAFGVGLYAQGGMGATYPNVKHTIFRSYDMNPFTQDSFVEQEYHSNIAYLKLSPTVAYQVLPELSVGLSLNVRYAMLEMKMPYSLLPAAMTGAVPGGNGMTFGDMFGAPMTQGGLGYDEVTAYTDMGDGVTAAGYGAKLGVHYQPTDKWTFGASYTTKSTLDFSGDVIMDMNSQFGDAYEKMVMGAIQQTATDPNNPTSEELQNAQLGTNQQLTGMGIDLSQGMQSDYDVDIEFSWPREFGVGTAFQATDKLVIAADLSWINWKDSMEKFVMKVTGGNNPNINAMMGTPDGKMTLEMPLEWDNQISLALGAEYSIMSQLDIRAGYNYAPNPVPERTIIPIFPAVVENHLTLGLGYNINDSLRIDGAYELALSKELKSTDSKIANEYDNHASKLGENILHFTASFQY